MSVFTEVGKCFKYFFLVRIIVTIEVLFCVEFFYSLVVDRPSHCKKENVEVRNQNNCNENVGFLKAAH